MIDPALIREVKSALANPRELANRLGLLDNTSEKQARGGIIVRCPVHDDGARPNLSLTPGRDGTVRAKCHACGWTGDALTLVAVMHDLDMRQDFRQVLVVAAELAGNGDLAADLENGSARPDRIRLPEARQLPEPEYPKDPLDLWSQCCKVGSNVDVKNMLTARGLDASRVEALNLVRSLPRSGPLPPWASFGKRNWRTTGHRAIVRTFDNTGQLSGVRAWRVIDNDTPKRLPPAGCRSAGLVLADRLGWCALTGKHRPDVLWIVEGEPDWLATALRQPGGHGVWGIGSGSWSEGFAEKARQCNIVMVATHPDDAGDRYADEIIRGLVSRGKDGEPDELDKSRSVPRATRWRPPSDLDECGVELTHLLGSAAKWLRLPHALGD
jgi:hypothetical protein